MLQCSVAYILVRNFLVLIVGIHIAYLNDFHWVDGGHVMVSWALSLNCHHPGFWVIQYQVTSEIVLPE